MKIAITLPLMIAACFYYSLPAYSTDQVPDCYDAFRDCSLALEMAQDDFVQNVIKGSKPLPSKDQQTKAMQCMNYVVGFKDALYVYQLYGEKNGIKSAICLPYNNLNNELAVRVVLKYLQSNPKMLNQPQAALMFNAFYSTFPCGK